MRHLYKFCWEYDRGGKIFGLYIADEDVVESHLGKKYRFGEVLGKHSDISGVFDEYDAEIVSSDEEFIASFEKIVGESYGYNPIQTIEDQEVESEMYE
jgi:hypothetical protein